MKKNVGSDLNLNCLQVLLAGVKRTEGERRGEQERGERGR